MTKTKTKEKEPTQLELVRRFRKQSTRLSELAHNFRTNAKFAAKAVPGTTPADAEAAAWLAAADAVEYILNTQEKGE